jgi:CubicO group peptidase (beta-lactamase class C family)
VPHRTATLEQELYALLGLVVEAASHRTLGLELNRSILGPLGLRDILLPDSAPDATAWDSWRSRRPPAPLLGNAGGIPGFLSIVLSTPDGRRQLGLMINALLAPAPVYEAFIQGSRAR